MYAFWSGRTARCRIARLTSLLSSRGGLGGCRRLALMENKIRMDSHYPRSGFGGQVRGQVNVGSSFRVLILAKTEIAETVY